MAIAPYYSRRHSHMDASTPPHILAVFAADRAIRCHFLAAILPPLPAITRNVTLPQAANPLEFGMRVADDADHKIKKRQKRQC